MSKPTWFTMKAENGVGVINILGDIGGFAGTDYQSFDRQLRALGPVNEIRMTINSPGGEVHDGFAIYNALAMHPANKTVTVMGLAASMASVVAMAGDKRVMPSNAMMMIHNPVGGIVGESDEIISYGEAVGAMRDKIAETYSMASDGKLTKAKALSLMDKQSWLTAEECLAYGLCTDVSAPVTMTAKFDISKYANAPANYGETKDAAADWACGAARGLPIDDQTAWNGPAAAARVLDDAGIGGDNPNPTKAKRAFLAYDRANPNLRGSYKLPFAVLVGGTLKASTAGIRAAASRLPQTDIPQNVKDTARSVLDGYEAKAKPSSKKESAMTTKSIDETVQFEDEATKKLAKEVADKVRADMLASQKQVNAICRVAGHPELAAKFNEEGKSLEEVVAELDKLPKGKAKPATRADAGDEINPRRAVDTGDEAAPVIDTARIYADYNRPGTITKRNENASRMN